ncbi:hypothetical protein BMS_3140 [Halobacteriovorax marinus SJ]|uniref:Uncharacterized protein n=1 Tax=Halobacteriovorax marinus (strain ATCC BAA-682 / DSM 15412 / SJ) TaxID=862908 RepID=E1WZW1_HALMS|nr:hypothetical protein [Halobacteriovorax marinus]CBW27897.1 hypothetical protein BMS_3140 [Halobacteriovorax marinus SJ]
MTRLYKILSKLPYPLQELPYSLCWIVTKTYLKNNQVELWPRNSYVSKRIVAALSDLDLTIIVSKGGLEEKVIRKYNHLKIIFPFLGEINMYPAKEVQDFIPIANKYELERDPRLCKDYGISKEENIYEKIVFLCKLIESDQENLKNNPLYRKKKWEKHLTDLGLSSEIDFESLIQLLNSQCSEIGIDASNFLNHYYQENRTQKTSCDNFYRECKNIKEYILLYPFRWIGSSLTCESFFHDIELIKSFTKHELSLLEAQLNWEIWGLFSQYLHNLHKATLHTHLENIRQVMDTNEALQNSSVYNKLNELRALHENSLLQYLENDRL